MIPRLLITAGAVLLLGATLTAQNLLGNGDFESGRRDPWVVTGYAVVPAIAPYTTNLGASPCYAVTPGNRTTLPASTSLEQTVLLDATVRYELTFDLAVAAPVALSSPVTVDTLLRTSNTVRLGGVAVTSFTAGEVKRLRYCQRFQPVTSTATTLIIRFAGDHPAVYGATPRAYVDNVSLRVARDPSFSFSGLRRVGTDAGFRVEGTALLPFAVVLSSGFGPPIRVPRFAGEFELDMTVMLLFAVGALPATGVFTGSVRLPADPGLADRALCWQAIEIDSVARTGSIGWPSLEAFHR